MKEETLTELALALGRKAGNETGCLTCASEECRRHAAEFVKKHLTSEQLFALDLKMSGALWCRADYTIVEGGKECITFLVFIKYIKEVRVPRPDCTTDYFEGKGFREKKCTASST